MTKDEQVLAGIRIEALLADAAVQKAFADLDQQYINMIKSSPAGTPALADAVAGTRAIEAVKSALTAVVDSGKFATAQLRKERERPRR
jgi:hypothetical protein